jgi:hypothetical protein
MKHARLLDFAMDLTIACFDFRFQLLTWIARKYISEMPASLMTSRHGRPGSPIPGGLLI